MKKTYSIRTIPVALRAIHDPMMRRMQTPSARKGMREAFNATPSELGRAAVESARKKR